MWCDPSNYGGIKCKPPTANDLEKSSRRKKKSDEDDEAYDEEEEEEGSDFSDRDDDDDNSSPEMDMNWNLASYLPEEGACQKNFNTVIAGAVFTRTSSIDDI